MNQAEVECFKAGKSAERLIYEAIKSYSSNGKVETSLSNREIAERASISYSTVNRHLPKLVEMGLIKVVGGNGHIGGVINTYKVLLSETVNVATRIESVADSTESVASIGTKSHNIKSNKDNSVKNILLSQHAIWEIANKNGCDISDVISTYYDVINPTNREKYKVKDSNQTLRNWVRRGISKGDIKTTSEFASLEILKFQEPKGDKANLLVQPE